MRVVFFGTPEFAVPSLEALVAGGIDVAAVVTQPDKPQGRSRSSSVAPPVKTRALQLHLPVLQPARPRNEDFLEYIRGLAPDLGIVVAYGHLLTPSVFNIPRLGMVNVHASLLPRWRGAAPIHWAILAGDRETGVAIMRIEQGLDTGAVWHAERTGIGPDDTSGSLTGRLAHLGAEALIATLPRIAASEAPIPQPADGTTHAPKVDRDIARIRWDEPASSVSCRLRAMDPAPGAWTTFDGLDVKLFRPGPWMVEPGRHGPGEILETGSQLVVAAGTSAIAIAEVQPAGRRRMSAAEWLRGTPISPGARFV